MSAFVTQGQKVGISGPMEKMPFQKRRASLCNIDGIHKKSIHEISQFKRERSAHARMIHIYAIWTAKPSQFKRERRAFARRRFAGLESSLIDYSPNSNATPWRFIIQESELTRSQFKREKRAIATLSG